MVEIDKVGFAYTSGKSVLSDVSFRVGDGAFAVLLGANGAGTSTLLTMVRGYLKPSCGRVLYDSEDVSAMSAGMLAARRSVLEQECALGFDYSVLETVMLGGFVRTDSRFPLAAAALEALERVGLAGFGERVYTKLSGGEKRRVQLARALCQLGDPRGKVLLLDEPSAGLDPAHAHAAMAAARRSRTPGRALLRYFTTPILRRRMPTKSRCSGAETFSLSAASPRRSTPKSFPQSTPPRAKLCAAAGAVWPTSRRKNDCKRPRFFR